MKRLIDSADWSKRADGGAFLVGSGGGHYYRGGSRNGSPNSKHGIRKPRARLPNSKGNWSTPTSALRQRTSTIVVPRRICWRARSSAVLGTSTLLTGKYLKGKSSSS